MSSERPSNKVEQSRSPELDKREIDLHKERIREHFEDLERTGERSPDVNKEHEARQEALEKAESIEAANKEERAISPAERRRDTPLSKKQLDESYTATMHEVQSQMAPAERAFSKVIHNETVEKTSEALGSTIARPNALLSGAIFAFVLTLSVYLIAKNLGYPLSGFESIGAFILGWIIGLLYDFLRVMITGNK